MKLAICTDVFADLSYTDMLDKVSPSASTRSR